MIKKIAMILMITAIIGLSLTGCAKEKESQTDSTSVELRQNNRFQLTNEYYYIGENKYSVVVDTQTKNLYLYNSTKTSYDYYVPSLTPLYDENGTITKQK